MRGSAERERERERDKEFSLRGQMLIASPCMGDRNFSRSLIYLCLHDKRGALGLVVNRRFPDVNLADLLEQLGIDGRPCCDIEVHLGGPVDVSRGFVLHSNDYHAPKATLRIGGDVSLTTTAAILKSLAGGAGPKRSFLALGYAGWGPGQLEREICANGWLTCSSDSSLLFSADVESRYTRALGKIGVSASALSSQVGRA